MKDEDGKYLYLNKSYEDQFVHSKDWYGKTDFDFWPKESAELFQSNDAEVLESGKIHQFMEDSTDMDGTRYIWLNYKFPFTDSKGEKYVGGIGIDATARVIAEEALKESETQLKTIIENLEEGLVVSDMDGTLIHWNPTAIKMHGFSSIEEGIRKFPEFADIFELSTIDGHVLPIDQWPAARILRGENLKDFEVNIRRINSNWKREFNYGGTLVRDAQNQPLMAVITLTDISDRKEAEEEIQRNIKLLEAINKVFEQSLTCETVDDVIDKCLEVAEDLTDSEFSFIGEINESGRLDDRALSPPGWDACTADHKKAMEMLSDMEIVSYWGRTIKEGKSQIVNDPENDPDSRGIPEGHPSITSFMGVPLKQGDKTVGMIALANKENGYAEEDRDNVETLAVAFVEAWSRKKAEIEIKEILDHLEDKVEERTAELEEMNANLKENELKLKDAVAELKRSNKELQSFAYITSHDLQEPLRTIASFTQLMERRYKGQLDEDADEFMDYIVDAAKRMKDMIQGLLEYSHVNRMEAKFIETDMNEILKNAISNLHSIIKESKADITYDNMPIVHCGPNQMITVFQNLIGNAIKFKKSQFPPRVHISSQLDKKNKEWVFSVEDNGIGMDTKYSNKIFEVFKRLHTTDEYEGTGIGLSIVKRIIETNGGRIWFESKLGAGSTFYFTLPVEPVETGGGAFPKIWKD